MYFNNLPEEWNSKSVSYSLGTISDRLDLSWDMVSRDRSSAASSDLVCPHFCAEIFSEFYGLDKTNNGCWWHLKSFIFNLSSFLIAGLKFAQNVN